MNKEKETCADFGIHYNDYCSNCVTREYFVVNKLKVNSSSFKCRMIIEKEKLNSFSDKELKKYITYMISSSASFRISKLIELYYPEYLEWLNMISILK